MSYISSAFPRFAEHMEPHEIVFQLAKTGKTRQLKQFLTRRSKDERKRIVATKYNGATSLIMSCRNGHYDVVEYLVEQCQANLEQSGLVNFEGENIEGAPPLWCASAAGHLKIVKYLVSKGANVNSTTKSNSTALRAACFDGHVEIVKFLVENDADIEIANRHGHTCLMIACYKGHLAIAKYLISKEADLNRKSVKGNTALHDCAECGSLEIMKLLLSHNAKMAPDAYQMTPLLAAAVTGHATIVEYLLTRPECTETEKIAALELLGATFVDKKHDMLSAYNYWKSALERRRRANSSTDTEQLSKESTVKHRPIEAYDFATEFMSDQELDDIISDPDDVRMQALLIRERILGPTHPDTTYYIRYRGAVYADCGNFRKCILLWLYALDTQQKSLDPLHPMIQSSFLSFTELFQYMQKQLQPLNSTNNNSRDTAAGNGGDLSSSSLNSSGSSTSNDSSSSNSNNSNNNNNNMFNMLNMYTATVLKILQQAVEEVKRGLVLLKQYQSKNPNLNTVSNEICSNSNNNNNLSPGPPTTPTTPTLTPTTTSNINQIQKQRIQSTLSQNTTNNNNSSTNINKNEQLAEPVVEQSTTTQQINFDMAHFDRTLVVIVHFLVVVAESLRHCSPEEAFKLKKLVYELIKLNPKNSKQSTLLHLASSRDSSSIIKNHTLSSFPSTEVLKILLECGADPNSLDGERNSPLHLAAANRHSSFSSSSSSTSAATAATTAAAAAAAAASSSTINSTPASSSSQSNEANGAAVVVASLASSNTNPSPIALNCERDKLIYLLLNAGTHLDACNANNKTASDLYKGGKLHHVINPINYLTLQCLAAKCIQKHKISYREHLTSKLSEFVSIH